MSAAVEPSWPPHSPYEALLSTLSGRHRVRRFQDRTSPSPSPLKKSSTTPNLRRFRKEALQERPGDEHEMDDEETLQLELQALEARIKLKKLQQKKAKAASTGSEVAIDFREQSRPPTRPTSVLSSNHEHNAGTQRQASSQAYANLQILASPQKVKAKQEEARSPSKVLLGIDKGLKGGDVSLRRPSSLRARSTRLDDPFGGDSRSRESRMASQSSTTYLDIEVQRPRTFSQRIAESRDYEKKREEQKQKAERLQRSRSTGFGVNQKELDAFKASPQDNTEGKTATSNPTGSTRSFSRDEVVRAFNKPAGGLLGRSNTVSGARGILRKESSSNPATSTSHRRSHSTSRRPQSAAKDRSPSPTSYIKSKSPSRPTSPQPDSSLFESYSSTHLSRRILPHSFLTRNLTSKSILLLPSLLRSIKSPDYILPESVSGPGDYVVFGIIASKSSPFNHKDASKPRTNASTSSTSLAQAAESEANTNGKYLVFTLTDLQWSLDLYLFTTAYTRYRKLTPGTVIAILNPSIMPPRPKRADTGRFSLVLNSSDDTVLEVGTSRDLGWCKAVKKDGKMCDSWVDKRHTEFCEWHIDQGVEKCRRGRMEVNSGVGSWGPGGKKTGVLSGRKRKDDGEDGLLKEGEQYDRGSGSKYFIAPSGVGGRGRGVTLLDENDFGVGRGLSKEERVRKRLAERENEKEIARKLGERGQGMGGEYLRLRHGDGKGNGDDDRSTAGESVDVGTLGLTGTQSGSVHLSPLKRKATEGGIRTARKKTRFVTEKGIKEAGRESFGGFTAREAKTAQISKDEDDLEIV
ncbi:hypothetical protein MMC20_002571 [Loxospora ochrophaea]|nr:hypothetical protein [Loxospora ochrophaea]